MHSAPSVNFPVGRSRLAAVLALGLLLAAASATIAWWAEGASGLRVGSMAAGTAVATVLALASWLKSPQGLLSWDGARWAWGAETPVAIDSLVPVLDLQRLMLLRCSGDACQRAIGPWLWVERGALLSDWHALRRAVYSRATPDALPEANLPSAHP